MRITTPICSALALVFTIACMDFEKDDGSIILIPSMGGAPGQGGAGGAGGVGGVGGVDGSVIEVDMMVEPPEPILVPEFGRSTERQVIVHARRSDGLSHPRDLEFDPDSPANLWVVDRDWDGNVILFDAGQADQTIARMRDRAASHFMEEVSGLAFSDRGSFATCQESRNDIDGFSFPNDFMGPALWSTDLMIHCNVNQGRGAALNGSHLDMLHQSPLCMGITHQTGHAFFVTDGANGHVVRYDFRQPHVPGGEDHSDGQVSRYPDLSFTRVPDIPSHLFLDGDDLYYADTGAGAIRVADMSTGEPAQRLDRTNEPLAIFNQYRDVSVRVFADGLEAPSGVLVANERVFVSLPTTGEIVAYGLDGVEIQRIDTGAPGIMGLEMGPGGRLWFVNADHGTVNVVDPGPVEVPEVEAPAPPQVGGCTYPEYGPTVGVGQVMPPYSWAGARRANQDIGELRAVDMFCGAEWQGVDTLIFVVVARWMRWIDEYVGYVDALSPQIEEAGGRIVYVGAQDTRGALLDSRATDQLLNNFTPQGSGIRVGARDNTYVTRLIDSGLITHLPSAFVVRRSDMMVLATQRTRMDVHLPYVEMAQEPTADWSNPGPATIRGVLPSNCEEGDEEEYEPNDSPDTAATIGIGAFDGGLCARRGDFYRVDVRGPWALELTFTHAVGDLDILLFNGNNVMRGRDGEPLGASSNDNNEYLEWRNPVTVYIFGHERATAPYRLEIRAR